MCGWQYCWRQSPVIENEPYAAAIREDLALGEVIATLSATDADEGVNAEIAYSITGGNSEGKFEIDAATGEISINQALDYEITGSYSLAVTASDKGTPVLTDLTTVSITIGNVNDNAPVAAADSYEAEEDTELE